MQIPKFPFSFGPGFPRQPQSGIRQQSGAELQVKAGAVDAARPARRGAKSASGATGLSTATTLAEAVRALRADGRLPRRGSLLDLSA